MIIYYSSSFFVDSSRTTVAVVVIVSHLILVRLISMHIAATFLRIISIHYLQRLSMFFVKSIRLKQSK